MIKSIVLLAALLLTLDAFAGGTPCMFKPGGCNGDEYDAVKQAKTAPKSVVTLKSILDPRAGGACCSWGPIKNCFPGC